MPPSPLPGQRWVEWVRYFPLRIGVLAGAYLALVLVAWVLIANRVPWSANFAWFRNAAAAVLLLLAALVPVLRFLRSPVRLFAAGVAAWAIFSGTFWVLTWFFTRLETRARVGVFHLFVMGAVVYGAVAVLCWVITLLLALRREPLATPRSRPR